MMPPWVKIAAPLAICCLFFFMGFKVASWKASGTIESLRAERDEAVAAMQEAEAFEEQWREDIKNINTKLGELQTQRDDALRRYHEEASKPPEVVVEYRDRVRTVREVIQAEECVDGVGELFTYLHSLPGRPQ